MAEMLWLNWSGGGRRDRGAAAGPAEKGFLIASNGGGGLPKDALAAQGRSAHPRVGKITTIGLTERMIERVFRSIPP